MTTVVNISKEDCDVCIMRHTPYGNPFPIGNKYGNRDQVIDRYEEYFKLMIVNDPEFKSRIDSLKGKKLGCCCKPKRCHGDIIANYLNGIILF